MGKKFTVRSVKEVLNSNFTFADLSPRFVNVDSTTGNIFCPFHENHETPAAKMYWNEPKQIWVLHCFACHRNYTAFDYVNIILCDRYKRYKNPLEFLKKNMDLSLMYMQIEAKEKQYEDFTNQAMSDKLEYINNVAEENETVESFIEALYTA